MPDSAPPIFPRADQYAARLGPRAAAVREPPARAPAGLTERHLQCVWYDPRLRPGRLRTLAGEEVTVRHPGRWNLEAGPDFLGAELELGGRLLRGDVELHLSAPDWVSHGHLADPRYARVVLHVTYFPGAVPASALPAGCGQLSLRDGLDALPAFSFEAIDLTAYPYAIQGALTPLRGAMAGLDADARRALLEAAGEERVLRKSLALAAQIRALGPAQALYREVMAALGYKHNKGAFRRLAEVLPLAALRDKAGGDPLRAFALLHGLSGLMPREIPEDADRATRDLLRRSWDIWWKDAAATAGQGLDPAVWRLDHIRPANHPVRRFMAAAWLFTRERTLDEELREWSAATPRAWLAQALRRLTVEADSFWRTVAPDLDTAGAWALVGKPRASAILINILAPYAAARGYRALFDQGLLSLLPAEPVNSVIKETLHALIGPDWPPSLITSALARQGLIQIFYDHLDKGE